MSAARIFLATLVACLVSPAATINFDSLSGGTVVTNQFQSSGLAFSRFTAVSSYFSGRVLAVSGTTWADIADTSGSLASTAKITIVDPQGSGTLFYTDSISFQSNGLKQTNFTSDFFDGISITAADINGQQVGSTFTINPVNGTTGRATVTVSFTGNIHELSFTRTTNSLGAGAAPMDDLVIGNLYSVADAPEPGTFLLLGASLGLAALLRRKSQDRFIAYPHYRSGSSHRTGDLAKIAASLALVAGVLVPSAMAGTLSYQGNALTLSGAVASDVPDTAVLTASVTLASDLSADRGLYDTMPTITGFSISDGTTTLTEANTFYSAITFATDSNGNITNWIMNVYGQGRALTTANPTVNFSTGIQLSPDNYETLPINDSSYSFGVGSAKYNVNPGTWSTSSTAPEPGTMALLAGAALIATGMIRRRRNF